MKQIYVVLPIVLLSYTTAHGQIVINEIRASDSNIELKNIGASTVDISTYWLCEFPTYNQLNSTATVCGDLNLDAGEIVMVDLTFSLSATDGELGLYINSDFGNPAGIVDYVEWGSTGHVRSIVAQAAGIWTAGDFVPAWDDCNSLEYDGSGDLSSDWVPQNEPTMPCIENSLDGCFVLPIQLLSFHVTPIKDGADIRWTGVYDETITHISLQHSIDRSVWNILTTWTPDGPDLVQGEFLHLELPMGFHYYRLVTTYKDGRSEPSGIEYIKMEYDSDKVSIWPNPTTGIVDIVLKNIDPGTEIRYTLKNINGKLCWQQAANASVQINLEGMEAGLFLLEVPGLGIAQRIVYAPN